MLCAWRVAQARHLGRPVDGFNLHGASAGRPLQTWKTFIHNRAEGIASIDLFVVPAITFRQLPQPVENAGMWPSPICGAEPIPAMFFLQSTHPAPHICEATAIAGTPSHPASGTGPRTPSAFARDPTSPIWSMVTSESDRTRDGKHEKNRHRRTPRSAIVTGERPRSTRMYAANAFTSRANRGSGSAWGSKAPMLRSQPSP
jgi:hypothetical protein